MSRELGFIYTDDSLKSADIQVFFYKDGVHAFIVAKLPQHSKESSRQWRTSASAPSLRSWGELTIVQTCIGVVCGGAVLGGGGGGGCYG